ncbi:MAG: DUF1822 family protein [Cyanobacteria bacterium J06639_18]
MMMTQIKKSFAFTVNLTPQAHQLAENFCSHHSNQQKSEKVYLNTLSIYAVNHYLRCLGFETDWKASNSYDVIMQSFLDVADLEVKKHGKLECRVVLPSAEFVHIPQEVLTARIGYIAVQLDESLQTATLLGYTKRVAIEELPLKQLHTLEEFPEYLQQVKPVINLNEWFEGVLQTGWQTLELLLTKESVGNLSLSFQDAFHLRGEKITEGVKRIKFGNLSVLILLALKAKKDEETSIRVRIYPDSEENYLPANIKLAILSDSGTTLKEVTSRSIDNFIQLPIFRCSSQESFKIQLSLNNSYFTESFFL